MDSNKLKRFKASKWRPAKSCATCEHALFNNSVWGLCQHPKNSYIHGKHKRKHQLPVHRGAVCNNYKAGPPVTEIEGFLSCKVTS